jgi:glycosyltransferase involved in cell wall biosynthesis
MMAKMTRASVVVPSKGCKCLKHLLRGLRDQSVRPYEVILVVKECDIKVVESLYKRYELPCVIVEQERGYFTHALNMGKKEAKGDILLFTDDDAIPLQKWVERYAELHARYRDVAGISSRDVYVDLDGLRLVPTADDKTIVRIYRWLVRPWLEPPHPSLEKCRLGVYLTRRLYVAHGPFIPDRTCYSLPFRGVNMSFKASYIYDTWFPEHESLKRAPGNEQHFGLQLLLKGFDIVYVPSNPVLHITRSESLSRTRYRKELLKGEFEMMKGLYRELLQRYGAKV